MNMQKQNLKNLFSTVKNYFSPKIIGEVNDVYIKIVKVKGHDVPWHEHKNEDELFYILKGRLMMELEGVSSFELKKGDLFIVKKSVRHRVYTKRECRLMLIENKSTEHTGGVDSVITKTVEEQHY